MIKYACLSFKEGEDKVLKGRIKKLICVFCMAIMVMGMTACDVNFTTSSSSDMSAVEYNTDYMVDKFNLDSDTAGIIANKLDEKDFGKIKSYKKKIVNGEGSMTFSDGKNKYIIEVADGYITQVTNPDGMVVMTIDDIQNAYDSANSTPATTQTDVVVDQPAEPQQTQDVATAEPQQTQDVVQDNTTDLTTDTTTNTPSGLTTGTTSGSTSGTTASNSTGYSYLTPNVQKILNSLDTDYNKINWGVQYSPEGMEGIVISVTEYVDRSNLYELVVAITNLYDEDVTVDAKGICKGVKGEEVGTVSFYESALGPGNTVMKEIYCDNKPTGEIYWSQIKLDNVFDKSAYWEADWNLTKDSDGYLEAQYTISSTTKMCPGTVTAVILDANGNVLMMATDFCSDEGKYGAGKVQFFSKGDDLGGKPADIALFCNPLASK